MAVLQSLTRTCGQSIPPGTKLRAYFTLKDELAGWPETKEEGGGTAQGDSKILDEPFDFTGAPVGKGFWRQLDILVDTGAVRDTLEGEIGGQGFVNRFDFFVLGAGAPQREFADLVTANAGCLIFMVQDKAGNHLVLGNLDNPVFVESAEGGTGTQNGDRVGFQYTLYSNTGYTTMMYDAATHGIDVTPVPPPPG
jgi:hypothetical protein